MSSILSDESLDLREARTDEESFLGKHEVLSDILRIDGKPAYYSAYVYRPDYILSGILDYRNALGKKLKNVSKERDASFFLTNDEKGNLRLEILSTSQTVSAGPLPYLDLGPDVIKLEPHFIGPCPNYLISGSPPDRITYLDDFLHENPDRVERVVTMIDDLFSRVSNYGYELHLSVVGGVLVSEKDGVLSLLLVPSYSYLTYLVEDRMLYIARFRRSLDQLVTDTARTMVELKMWPNEEKKFEEYKVPEINPKYSKVLSPLIRRIVSEMSYNVSSMIHIDMLMCLASLFPEKVIARLTDLFGLNETIPEIDAIFHEHLKEFPYARVAKDVKDYIDSKRSLLKYQKHRTEIVNTQLVSRENYIYSQILFIKNVNPFETSDISQEGKIKGLQCIDHKCEIEENLRSKRLLKSYGLQTYLVNSFDFSDTLPERYKEEHAPFEKESYKINGVEFSQKEARIFFSTPLEGLLRACSNEENVEVSHLTLKDLRLAKSFLNGLILIGQYYSELSEGGYLYLSYDMSLLHWSELNKVRMMYEDSFSLGEPFLEYVKLPEFKELGFGDFF